MMHGRAWFWIGVLIAAGAGAATSGPVIVEGDSWRYYKGRTSEPPLQNGHWTTVGYNDAINWGGPAPSGFGYGDNDDATLLADMQNQYLSFYTRRKFTIADTNAVTHLTLVADYDDGFVAYLNGVEVARRQMPDGPVTWSTPAAFSREASRSGETEYHCNCDPRPREFMALPPALLVSGTNVLAISGHNASLSSSDFSMIFELYTNITLMRGPILQMPEPGRMAVTWHTDALTDSVVEFGPDTAYGAVVSNSGPVREHVVLLPPAPVPGATVHYRIRSGGHVLAANHFRAPPAPGQPFRMAVIGDFGSPTTNTAAVADQIAAAGVDLVVTIGDNIYQDGQPGSFDAHWFHPYREVHARAPVFPALGNHDINAATGLWTLLNFVMPTNGPPGLEQRNYAFDFGNARMIVIDSNPFDDDERYYVDKPGQRAAIAAWLANDLATTTQDWRFVFYHHPAYTSRGSHNPEALVQSELAPLFETFGVHLAFQGHNHFYERINPINGVPYVTSGGGGFSLHAMNERRPYSARYFNSAYSFVLVDVDGPSMVWRCIDQTGVERDRHRFDLDHPFRIDGLLDDPAWLRAENGLKLHAAIRGRHLYVATQDAGEGSDHFIYIQNQAAGMTNANWAKTGQVMAWSAFLADENDGGFVGWFGPSDGSLDDPERYRAMTSGLNNNGALGNGVLEGTLDLAAHFGAFPAALWLAAAPYGTANGGALVTAAQVPAGNGNGHIEPDEYLVVSTRAIALDLPVAQAAAPAALEAGMMAVLDGTASHAPSGLPLTAQWTQIDGPTGVLSHADQWTAGFHLAHNITEPTNVTLQLSVHDTRFAETARVEIVMMPMVDSDGDGLSDGEELTGMDNVLTPIDPAGRTSDPALADSDGDGMADGAEAVAGTDPRDPASRLAVTGFEVTGVAAEIRWPSVPDRRYALLATTNLAMAPVRVVSNITATPPTNAHPLPPPGAGPRFYTLDVQPAPP